MADDPKPADPAQPPTPPTAAADKPAGPGPAEPLKREVSRTDALGAGASAAPAAATSVPVGTASVPSTSVPAGSPASPPRATVASAAPKSAAAPAPKEHPPRASAPTGPPDPPPPADKTLPAFIASLQAAVSGAVTQVSFWLGDWTVIVPAARILDVARHLRDAPDASFDMCSDVTATDWPPRAERFDIVYCLYSTRHRHRVRVKAKAGEMEPVPSVTVLWPAANWLEREVYDMFGVNFVGHPDRRRILMPEDWQGFPQRKDYPLEGPGELLMENPLDWLKLKQSMEEADIE